MPRSLAVIAVYLAFFTTLVGAGFLLAGPVADQARSFQRDVPDLVDDANDALHDLQVFFDDNGIDVEIERQGETRAHDAAVAGCSRARARSSRSPASSCTRLVETGFHILLVVVLSIYMLIYAPQIGGARAPRDAARRRHAGRTTSRRASSAPSTATCAASCCSA